MGANSESKKRKRAKNATHKDILARRKAAKALKRELRKKANMPGVRLNEIIKDHNEKVEELK